MKIFNSQLLFHLLVAVAISSSLSSCQKKFDAASYAPEKPFGGYNSSKEIAPGNLVAYWSFEGSVTDSAGGLTGTNNGTTFLAKGEKGQALQVGGSNYYLFNNPGTVLPNLKAFTVAFWMNSAQNTSYAYGIFSLNNPNDFWGSLDIYIDNGGTADSAQFKCHFNTNGNGQFQGVKIGKAWNQWVHMVITYDSSMTTSSNFNIYQNGSVVYSTLLKNGSANLGPITFPGPTAMVLGTWQFQTNPSLTNSATAQPWAGSFAGALDEFRIYDKALKAGDVNALFKLEAAGR
ncbi:MAG TPA: LamG domain-containing protein [Puia sp.]|jgi:hypothetical protein|nr:LamG domain-containing protein [Puia sp.]